MFPGASTQAKLRVAAYAGYRALNGQIMLQPAGSVTHNFSDADGTLSVAELQVGAVRELANDVTLSGAEEPAAYISESFVGDGTTTVFSLSESAYRDANRTLINDSFDGAAIDTTQWSGSDPGGHISLGAGGLTMSGGTGQDGQTTLTALDALEIGGSIVVELGGVVLGAASDWHACGLVRGPCAACGVLCGISRAAEHERDRRRDDPCAGAQWRGGGHKRLRRLRGIRTRCG